MIKICMAVPLPPPYGGIANWSVLLDEYVKNVDDVEFLHINTAPKKRSTEGRTLWDRVVVQGFGMLSHKKALKNLIKTEKPDLVHITTSGQLAIIRDILMLKTAKKNKLPSVYHLRFGRIPEIAQNGTREWKMLRKAMTLADRVIAIDNSTLEAVKKYAPEVNVLYVPNPFDEKKLCAANIPDSPETKNEIVFVGWVIKTKGIEELLLAWQKVYAKNPEWSLKIIGPYDNEYINSLREKYCFEGVNLTGEMPNDKALCAVSEAKIFTLPSHTEGFPNAVLEAMALKKAVVATNVGAIPEMLEGCGIVVKSRDPEMLTEALEDLINDPELRLELSEKAFKKLSECYTIDKVFSEYRNIWESITLK